MFARMLTNILNKNGGNLEQAYRVELVKQNVFEKVERHRK